MGKPQPPLPTKPVIGIISSDPELWKKIAEELPWGTIDGQSPTINFDFTDYYAAEMGTNLFRLWLSFKQLLTADQLADLKQRTNQIEQHYLNDRGGRRCNIDPGLVSLHSLILATTKPAAHRVYLKDGIYAEVTLTFRNQTFEPLPWTYLDYRTETAIQFFLQVRAKIPSCQDNRK
jgi:hypothetical protein